MAMFAQKSTDEAKGLLVSRKFAEEVGKLASKNKNDVPIMIQVVKMANLNKQTEDLILRELAIHYVFEDLLHKGGFGSAELQEMKELKTTPSQVTPKSSNKMPIDEFLLENKGAHPVILELARILNLNGVVELITGEKTSRIKDLLIS